MNLNFLKVEEPGLDEIDSFVRKHFSFPLLVERKVERILDRIKKYGDKALVKLLKKYDKFEVSDVRDIFVTEKEKEVGYKIAEKNYPELLKAINLSYQNIKLYHENQLRNGLRSWSFSSNGKKLGQILNPIQRVGVYIPGGRYIYPSSVLMTVVPAIVAGVEEIAICTPPKRDGSINEVLLYLFSMLGISEVYKMGGAHAIGALAYGTETISRVDKIVGPGNIYVTIAKKKVMGVVGIDGLAGPSEIVILSDKTANPRFVASDLISQAEHDPDAVSILVSTDKDFAFKVIYEIGEEIGRISRLPNSRNNVKIILDSLKKNCKIFFQPDIELAVEICNRIAPEHLEIMTENPESEARKIKNAGAIFLGNYTPVAAGDYTCGTNHVIPTGGTARFSSPLGVYDFLKISSIAFYDRISLEREKKQIEFLSDFEGLIAHKNSIRVRFESLE